MENVCTQDILGLCKLSVFILLQGTFQNTYNHSKISLSTSQAGLSINLKLFLKGIDGNENVSTSLHTMNVAKVDPFPKTIKFLSISNPLQGSRGVRIVIYFHCELTADLREVGPLNTIC